MAATATMATAAATGKGKPTSLQRAIGDHAAHHHERALREVHDAAGVVDDAEADADQAIDAADRDAGQRDLGKI